MAFRLPRLPASEPTWPQMQLWWQQVVEAVETQENTQDDLLTAVVAAQTAADTAQTAADAADTAAAAAQTAADTAATAAEGANSVASLTNSGVVGTSILTATDAGADATITVAAHTRVYGDGATVSVTGPTNITGLTYSTNYFVYYDDPTRADTTPSYQTTTSEATAAQTGDRHLVGMVTTPAAAAPPTDGFSVRAPGIGGINP